MNQKIISFFIFFFIFSSLRITQAQDFNRIDIPIIVNNKVLSLSTTGGLRAGQFSNIDFNGDGVLDLFVFDRNGDQIIPLIKTGAIGSLDYTFAPEYISMFPKLRNWCLLADFNNDGVTDIFTSSNVYPGSVEVWKGKKNGDRLSFTMLTFGYGLSEILTYPISNGYAQIYVSSIDLPAVADVDNDGDVDIISFEPDGSFATYYENQSVEENLGLDSIKYIRKDICWGKFSENQFSELVTLSNSPFSCSQGLTSGGNVGVRHSGSTLCVFDTDGDGDMDLLLGDLASPKLKKLTNGGNQTAAFMTAVETDFPADDVPVFLDVFLSAFYVDCNGDGRRDLVVTPNDGFNAESIDHIWLYENIGTDAVPKFKFVKSDFLIDEMLYFNSASHPAFVDVDGDGLEDIVVGSNGFLTYGGIKQNRIYLLKNIGTATSPKYELTDDDYLNFSKYDETTGRFAPCFGDIDGDEDQDLIIGDLRGFLYFLENTAGKGNPMSFSDPIYEYKGIFIGQHATPKMIDLDRDGLVDIVVGEKNNQLNFFKNIGSTNNPNFEPSPSTLPNTDKLGNIFATGNNFDTQSGSPFFIKQEGLFNMLLGTESGNILAYDHIEDNTYGNFTKWSDKIGNINQGRRVHISLANIDGDDYYEMAIGNERGGLVFYNTNFKIDGASKTTDSDVSPLLSIFPNPAVSSINIARTGSEVEHVTIFDLNGRAVLTSATDTDIDISNLPSGMYILKVTVKDGRAFYRSFVKI